MVLYPFVGGYPEVAVGKEFLLHLGNLLVICYFHLKETFTGIEFSGIFLELLQTFVDVYGGLGNIFSGLKILKGVE